MGNPINAGTGNKFQLEKDYIGTGAFPLRLERMYNSGSDNITAVEPTQWGAQWRSSYDRVIMYGSDNTTMRTAYVERQDGKIYEFKQAIGTATPPLTTTTWTASGDIPGVLVATGVDANGIPTGFLYTNEQDEVEAYAVNTTDGGGNPLGILMSITNRVGLVQTLTYSDGTGGPSGGYVLDAAGNPTTTILRAGLLIRVADPAGRSLQFGYDGAEIRGRVVKMTDPGGGVYHYTYDTLPNLGFHHVTSVTYPDGKVRTYLYAEAANVSSPNPGIYYDNSLTGILDENGTRYASWTYDSANRATSSWHGALGSGIDKVTLTYTAPDASGNSTTSITDAIGASRTKSFAAVAGVARVSAATGQPCKGCAAALGYDANANVTRRTDFNGNTSCYTHDLKRNLETVRVEGLAPGIACPTNLDTYTPSTAAGSVERKISTQWHPTFRVPSGIAQPLRITTYVYDAYGNVLGKTVQPTTDATGGAGFSATASGAPRVTSYTYNAAGQVLTSDGPRTDLSDITQYVYDSQHNLTAVINPLNQVTTLGAYDAHGHVGAITDPNGLVATLTYDLRGRLTTRSVGGETTHYTYDGAGNLTNVALATGASYTYAYDAAHRLTQITDSQGNTVTYTLDNAGNRTREDVRDSTGTLMLTHSRQFDTLNRLWKDIGAVNQTTTYTYDNEGNLLTTTDPLNRLTGNAYDALNHLKQVTNPDNSVIQYTYDGLGRLAQVTDPRNLVTQYTRDGLGGLTQQTSPDTGVTNATYDAAGNLLTRTDAKGQTATYTYDALNRVSTISYSGGATPPQAIAYQYDQGVNGVGRLTGITDSTGVTSYAYDQYGRLTTEGRMAYGALYATSYAYDAQGRLYQVTYPSGRAVTYAFDVQGRISQVASTLGGATQILASNITYEPFGGIHSFSYGDGVTAPIRTYTRQHDQDGRIASYTLNGGRTMSILYDAASQISTISDSQNLPTPASYTYDPMSRLTSYIQGATNQSYGYDVDGNRVSQTVGATTTAYTYGAGSNWLLSTQAGGGALQPVSHDANGASTADATRQFAYDLRGRLIQTTTAQGVINYEVNALGLRVRKQVPYANSDTLYHYDLKGHVIAESANGTTQFSREYVYLGDQPIAVLQ